MTKEKVDILDLKISETLTVEEYKDIMNEIWRNHRFGSLSGYREDKVCRNIKYIRPSWDMRTGACFNIIFDDVTFHFRGTEESMYSRILDWLDGNNDVVYGGLSWNK